MFKKALIIVLLLAAGFCLAEEISVIPTDDMYNDYLVTGILLG